MSSKDIESASDSIEKENSLQLRADSSQNLSVGQTHSSQKCDPNDKHSDKSQISTDLNIKQKNDLKGEPNHIECAVNISFVEEPKGVFEDKTIRNGFIQKVYGILFVQILFTGIIAGLMLYFLRDRLNLQTIQENNDGTALFVVMVLLFVSIMAVIGVSCAFCCCKSTRRTVPINYILLGIFTIAWTYLVGFICAQKDGQHILIALGITCVVVLSITLLACTPWFDITNCGCLLCILFLIHLIGAVLLIPILSAFGFEVKPLLFVSAVFGAFIFSLYLLYDTQLILGGKKHEMSPEEYVYAAMCLYMDIIQIFLHILQAVQNYQ